MPASNNDTSEIMILTKNININGTLLILLVTLNLKHACTHACLPAVKVAKAAINVNVPLRPGCEDAQYLHLLAQALDKAGRQFDAEFVFYNAGVCWYSTTALGVLLVHALLVHALPGTCFAGTGLAWYFDAAGDTCLCP